MEFADLRNYNYSFRNIFILYKKYFRRKPPGWYKGWSKFSQRANYYNRYLNDPYWRCDLYISTLSTHKELSQDKKLTARSANINVLMKSATKQIGH